jgi:hypothetical protein
MRLDTINLSPEFTLLVAVIVGIVGSARFVRLITADTYPPVVKLRIWWSSKTKAEGWEPLLNCPWCFAPYVVALNMAAAILSHLHPIWWVVNGWLAAAYVSSWIVFHDED